MARANGKAMTQMLANRELATRGDIAGLKVEIAEVKTLIAETAVMQVKDFHSALFGFAAVIAACIALAVAILK